MSLASSMLSSIDAPIAMNVEPICFADNWEIPNCFTDVFANSSILYAMLPNAVSTTFCTSWMSLAVSIACFPKETSPAMPIAKPREPIIPLMLFPSLSIPERSPLAPLSNPLVLSNVSILMLPSNPAIKPPQNKKAPQTRITRIHDTF